MLLSPQPSSRLRLAARLLLPALLLGGCISEPGREQQGMLVSARRVLALDFGKRHASARLRDLQRLPAALTTELRRGRAVADEWPRLLPDLERPRQLWRDATAGARFELSRRPRGFDRFVPTPRELAQHTADSMYVATRLLGSGLHPLGEISDHEHRTDHTDDRPELSLWDRIWRRLAR